MGSQPAAQQWNCGLCWQNISATIQLPANKREGTLSVHRDICNWWPSDNANHDEVGTFYAHEQNIVSNLEKASTYFGYFVITRKMK